MYNRSVIDDNTIMKELKMAEKSLKKGLTKNVWRCILTELSRESAYSTDPWKRYRIKKTNARCDFHESHQNKDSQFVNEFWAWSDDFRIQYRIKHKSLILAQDERWRRA